MGSCVGKTTNPNRCYSSSPSPNPPRRFEYLDRRYTDVPKLLNKQIQDTFQKGIISETEYFLTYVLFTYMLNRLESSMDPLFVIQMQALNNTLDDIIQERCKYPPPAAGERYADKFEDFFLSETRKSRFP
jgi:hypothetical protein